MRRAVARDEITANVQAVDVRTGRLVGVFLDGSQLQVVAPDRITGRGVTVTEFPLGDVVLAGRVARPVLGRRGGWVLTRAVRLDDPDWGAVAPAWSWLFAPDDSKVSRRFGEQFVADLRRALPRARWVKGVTLSRPVRDGRVDPGEELLELALRREETLAAACAAVEAERAREAAGLAEEAERVLLDSLRWRSSPDVTTLAP